MDTQIFGFLSMLQVLSKTVADAMEYIGDESTKETIRFVRTFDRFFDMLNTRSLEECVHKLKPDLAPYRYPDDSRLKVHTVSIVQGIILCFSGLSQIFWTIWRSGIRV